MRKCLDDTERKKDKKETTGVPGPVVFHMKSQEEDDMEMPKTTVPNGSTVEARLQHEEMPVKLVPCIGHTPIRIDPGIISDHLAVLSIKTEPLEKLNETCHSRIGISLTELRQAYASGKNIPQYDPGIPEASEAQRKKERRASLDMAGRLKIRPKELCCRNSFTSLIMPDISKVELLKDVESNQDLIVRLEAHDIDKVQVYESDIEDNQVLSGPAQTPPLLPPSAKTIRLRTPSPQI